MDLYVKISFITILSLFLLVFRHGFIRRVDLTHIAASNTAIDDVTNKVTHRIFNTDLIYSCAHFVIAGFDTI